VQQVGDPTKEGDIAVDATTARSLSSLCDPSVGTFSLSGSNAVSNDDLSCSLDFSELKEPLSIEDSSRMSVSRFDGEVDQGMLDTEPLQGDVWLFVTPSGEPFRLD